jgi:hypothetical protein
MENDNSAKLKNKTTDAERLSKFPFRVRTSAYGFESPANHPGYLPSLILREDGVTPLQTRCIPNYDGIDLSGGSITDPEGRMTWRLSNFVCPSNEALVPDFPVSFVATPVSEKPGYITVKDIALEANDLAIDVHSWDSQGNPAASTYFYWRCRIPLTYLIQKQPPATHSTESINL